MLPWVCRERQRWAAFTPPQKACNQARLGPQWPENAVGLARPSRDEQQGGLKRQKLVLQWQSRQNKRWVTAAGGALRSNGSLRTALLYRDTESPAREPTSAEVAGIRVFSAPAGRSAELFTSGRQPCETVKSPVSCKIVRRDLSMPCRLCGLIRSGTPAFGPEKQAGCHGGRGGGDRSHNCLSTSPWDPGTRSGGEGAGKGALWRGT